MTTPHPSRRLGAAALCAIVLPACANLKGIYQITSPVSDTEANVDVLLWQFPAPDCEKLALPCEVRSWLEPANDTGASSHRFVALSKRPETGIIVNTDVDDTLMARFWDRERYSRDQLYPGVLSLLLAEGRSQESRSLVALTARPTEDSTRAAFCGWFEGEFKDKEACKDLGVSTGELGNLTNSLGMGLVKAEALLGQRRAYPHTRTVFNGDSGQGDWIAALIASDLYPPSTSEFYATIHDVRAWSPEHRAELSDKLADSDRLADIYRRAFPIRQGEPSSAYEARLDERLRKIRGDIIAALAGPRGRLDGELLRGRGIFLHRNYAALALDLADAHLIDQADADHVLRTAVPALCFAPDNEFGFDSKDERDRLEARLLARVRERPALKGTANADPRPTLKPGQNSCR